MEALILFAFDEDEREDIVRDVAQLAAVRPPGVRRALYYWTELIRYPAALAWDGLRHGRPVRTRGGEGMTSTLLHDLKHAARGLRKDLAFTVTAIGIITIGLGSTTAIYSVIEGVLLDPLPVEDPDRLVSVWLANESGQRSRMTPGNFTDLAGLDDAFASVSSFRTETGSLSTDGGSVFLRGGAVTPGYFETLGVELAAGRPFYADEADPGGPGVVVFSHHVWEQAFGADPEIIGRTVEMDGGFFEVIGVAEPGLYPTQASVSAELPFTASNQDFFVPLRMSADGWTNRRSHILGMIARLPETRSPEEVTARVDALAARLRESEPLNRSEHFVLTPFAEEVVGDVRFGLVMLFGMVGLVLLIAVVNVGALVLLRSEERTANLAIRQAVGASRARLLRLALLESTIVVLLAVALSVTLAEVGIDLMRGLVPYQIPRLADVGVSGRALMLLVGAGAALAVVLGAAPVSRFVRSEAGTGMWLRAAGPGRRRAQAAVVALQAGLCVVVLVGAGLLSRSYAALRAVDTGFAADATWTMSLTAPLSTLDDVVREVRVLPSVRSAAIAYDHPLSMSWVDGFLVEGYERPEDGPPLGGALRPFGVGYFDATGIDFVEGRAPDEVDLAGDVGYAVINESLRETFLSRRPAIGARITLPTAQRMLGEDGVFEVIGVVRDVRFRGPDQASAPALYVPLTHFPVSASVLLVEPETDDTSVVDDVRAAVVDVDPGLGLQRARRLSHIMDDLTARPRFNMMLLLAFGDVGLLLSGLGAYGLVMRTVRSRRREIGVEMALGAPRARVARSVMSVALRPVAIGALLGIALAATSTSVLQALLFQVSPSDPVSFVGSVLFVIAVGTVAAIGPTLRALRIDPARTLRD